ncbi:aminoglycoside N(3)-acetyltransferase [Streptomyces sp. NPDC059070]|uniref:aminoglycoside N(3)-acetyltransferase n=1 Tax=unclassified Streptomyces TaxID=2593676 RepID=UPI0034E1A41F
MDERAAASLESALLDDLVAMGVREGDTLLVHASLSGLGHGPRVLGQALCAAVGGRLKGTLVVPAFTPENSLTSSAHHRRARQARDPAAYREFRRRMPAFDPEHTPSQGMGRLAEWVRTSEGAVRSGHPQTSFAAWGSRSLELMAEHEPDCHLGERSPLAALCRSDAKVLMINVPFAVCSAFHLAEYRYCRNPPKKLYSCVVRDESGRRGWFHYPDVDLDDSDFETIGADLPEEMRIKWQLGRRTARLFSIKGAVDHAVEWMTEKRPCLTER